MFGLDEVGGAAAGSPDRTDAAAAVDEPAVTVEEAAPSVGNGSMPSLWANGSILLCVLLPCCLTTYVNLAMVSASFSCWALKCFRIEVASEPGDCEPRMVDSGSAWFRVLGITFGSSVSTCCCCSSGVSRDVLDALSAGFERES